MEHDDRNAVEAWLAGEVLLFGLLGASLALFAAYQHLRPEYPLPLLRLVLQTTVVLAGAVVAVLAALRFSVEGRRLDLFLASGFLVSAGSTLLFSIAPTLGGQPLHRVEAWAGIGGRLLGWSLIAAAPFARGRARSGERAVLDVVLVVGPALLALWIGASALGGALPPLEPGHERPFLLTAVIALEALAGLVAVIGFGLRFRSRRNDLDRWLALGATPMLFASLGALVTPPSGDGNVTQGDFLRLLAYGVLLVGVWRAIRASEFGRAVAEERARVAREIHDGLAQYLFAISTHASMLEGGADAGEVVPRLKEAAAAAQQEARFAVLALSSASGTAPFGAALRRYVEFLTADGALDVELEIDPGVALAPDEQIEVFRIVQEGLANVRKHAGALRAEVSIGERGGRRLVEIRDDGAGFGEGGAAGAGQGLRNMRARTAAIGAAFRLHSGLGRGTALEVTLRA